MKIFIQLGKCIVLVFLIFSCDKKDESTLLKYEIQGFAQKGPYIIGSTITIYELNADLTQTGKSFTSQITDNSGSFSMSNLELKTQFIETKVDGFYYNEISGDKSSAPLTLFALSDISDKSKINTNIISNLEKERVKYLLGKGYSFNDSKNQAESEILNIFSFTESVITSSELLDISMDGDENAMLLAVSLILQGYGTVADLSELLSNISYDIKEDGKLDNQILGTKLINNAKYLNLSGIRQNIESRYLEIGVDAHIGNFEKYIAFFLDNSKFTLTELISYPKIGSHGENFLSDEISTFKAGTYSIAAYLPTGTTLKIILIPVYINYNLNFAVRLESYVGWSLKHLYSNDGLPPYPLSFTAIGSSTQIDNCSIDLINTGTCKLEFFENDALTPTKTKIMNW